MFHSTNIGGCYEYQIVLSLTGRGTGPFDGQLSVTHDLLLGLDFAELGLLDGQTTLVVRTVCYAQGQERVPAELWMNMILLL